MYNTTFMVGNTIGSQSDATLIFTGGSSIDYGNCTPGTTPGEVGAAVYVAVGDWQGCPFKCVEGNYGPGGSTSYLRSNVTSLCSVGSET